MTFGEKVHKLRTERGLTMDELSRMTGIAQQTISSYETGWRGNPRPVNKFALARAFHVKPSELDDDREEVNNGKADNPCKRP